MPLLDRGRQDGCLLCFSAKEQPTLKGQEGLALLVRDPNHTEHFLLAKQPADSPGPRTRIISCHSGRRQAKMTWARGRGQWDGAGPSRDGTITPVLRCRGEKGDRGSARTVTV